MTDYFKGLLQRSMGLTPVVKPLVRPQFAIDVASAGLSGAPAGAEQSPASPADAYQPMIPAEPFQTATGVTHGSQGPAQASDTNNALPTPERQPERLRSHRRFTPHVCPGKEAQPVTAGPPHAGQRSGRPNLPASLSPWISRFRAWSPGEPRVMRDHWGPAPGAGRRLPLGARGIFDAGRCPRSGDISPGAASD